MTDMIGSTSTATDLRALQKEWDDASCPICMDHPHNAVLLLCSSHDKGCRSYICDTSYRHSNCLDRFKKLRCTEHRTSPTHPALSLIEASETENRTQRSLQSSESMFRGSRMRRNFNINGEGYSIEEGNDGMAVGLSPAMEENNSQDPNRHFGTQTREADLGSHDSGGGCLLDLNSNLKCPLCRGTVGGWKIVKDARQYLDMKQRSCSQESCIFSGNYRELRRHARRVHPTTRPADVDPSRQRAWRHLEHQREYGDIVSAIRTAMPGAIVLGDYVLDNGDGISSDREGGPSEASGSWWTTFFLFHMVNPIAPVEPGRGGLSRTWRRHRRSSSSNFAGHRRNLWGENLLGLQDDDEDEWSLVGDMGDDNVPVPRRRRRFTRSRPNEDEP